MEDNLDRESFCKEVSLELKREPVLKNILSRGNSKGKEPQTAKSLISLKNRKEASVDRGP